MKTLLTLSLIAISLLCNNSNAFAQEMLKDINPSGGGTFSTEIVVYNGKLYFGADDGVSGQELWTTDGTATGTQLFKDIVPGSRGSYPKNFTVSNENLYFSFNDLGRDVWPARNLGISDGTSMGTTDLLGSSPLIVQYLRKFTPLGDKIYFEMFSATHEQYLIGVTDGTASGTGIAPLENFQHYLSSGEFASLGGLLYFATTYDSLSGFILNASDGTESGTRTIGNFPTHVYIPHATELNGKVYFAAGELYVTEGTSTTTSMVKDIKDGPDGSIPNDLTVYNGKIYFSASDGIKGNELWVSDGTRDGTYMLKDINAIQPDSHSYIRDFLVFNEKLYFTALDGIHGRELWVTDGTEGGTRMVMDICPGSCTGMTSWILEVGIIGDRMFFPAKDGRNGIELWETDGTEGGTNMVMNINPGRSSSRPVDLAVYNNNLYFSADDGTHGKELWKYSGSPLTTVSPIIPKHFREYEHIEFDLWKRYPDWCWTEIFFDWKIEPICPVPEVCPDRLFQASFTGPKGETVWQEKFEKPLKMSFPVEGKQPYTFSLATLAEGEPEDLFIMDDDLVTDGFTGIHMTMIPKEDFFKLSVSTENGQKLPFELMLLNEKGETVWQQEFMAPMDEQIKAEIEGNIGTTLRFASISEGKDLRDYGITEVNHYPNAFAGKLKVEVRTADKKKVPLSLTIYDAKGNQVLEKQMIAPLDQSIELYGKKEGLYILELKAGKAVHTKNIILEY